MYTLTGVTKQYQKGRATVDALAGVDAVIEDGEWLAIQGPTGHGKTTCCRCWAGWTGPPRAWWISAGRTWPRCGRPR